MRRSEERLKYWLEGGCQSQKKGFAGKLVHSFSLWLRLGSGIGSIREEVLGLDAKAVSLDEELASTAYVRDGIGELGSWSAESAEAFCVPGENNAPVRDARLLMHCRTFDTQLPNGRIARIRAQQLEIKQNCRKSALIMQGVEVLEPKSAYCQPPQLMDGERLLIAKPGIHSVASNMAGLPHARTSIRVEELHELEHAGFLREAEVLKGIPPERARLLAVFRKVPIEIISRLRFLEDKKTILYSISRESQLSKTRVHDMCAVRDIQTKEIYLVPHRTRFRSVSLN